MKRMITATVATILADAVPALAAGSGATTGASLLVALFFGFGALIVVCQLIPSMLLFCSMIRGLFGGAANKSIPKTGIKSL